VHWESWGGTFGKEGGGGGISAVSQVRESSAFFAGAGRWFRSKSRNLKTRLRGTRGVFQHRVGAGFRERKKHLRQKIRVSS